MKERALIALLLAALRQLDHAYSASNALPIAGISDADLRAAWEFARAALSVSSTLKASNEIS